METIYCLLVIFIGIQNKKKHPQENNIYTHVFCDNQVAEAVAGMMCDS